MRTLSCVVIGAEYAGIHAIKEIRKLWGDKNMIRLPIRSISILTLPAKSLS
ncbi:MULTISPECIES: hypothetical protein [unclassified Paenibacillus]|uniref:hypothetical protein n=1 Tax=unclassified Paenibacillus TaxID=185978 RepID=UPI0008D43B98|nr:MULTISPECIES: hypothetical protein [unclassified Paenibacillus]QLG39909.1 hypothetical protein HW560_18530 [Paenibacillus sp. E222]SEN92954.1 hypothetical protein SAMN05518670_3094 [Paenibacillus sp. OK076]